RVAAGLTVIGWLPSGAVSETRRSAALQIACDSGETSPSNPDGSGSNWNATTSNNASAATLHVRYARLKRSDAPSRARTSAAAAHSTSGGTTSGTNAASTFDPNGSGTQTRYTS